MYRREGHPAISYVRSFGVMPDTLCPQFLLFLTL
jgi:hypothetical protein